MPHSASAKKRHRQNLRNRDRHRIVKSELRSKIRKVLESISTGDVTGAKEMTRSTDRAAAAGTIHRNRAARIKSRISARLKNAEKGVVPTNLLAKGRSKAATKA